MRIIILLLIFFLYIGNNVYIFNSAISPLNILYGVLILASPFIFSKYKYNIKFLNIFILHIIFFIISSVFLVLFYEGDIEELKDYYYLSFFVFMPILFYVAYDTYRDNFIKLVFNSVLFMNIISVLILIYEFITGNHLPMHTEEKHIIAMPSAFFRNPNDIAALLVLTFPFLFYYSKSINQKKIMRLFFSGITLLGLLITMSRLSIILFFLFPIFYFYVEKKIFKSVAFIVSYTVIFIFLLNLNIKEKKEDNYNVVTKNFNKILSVLSLDERLDKNNSSISTRFYIYSKPFLKPQNYIIGKGFRGDKKDLSNDINTGIVNGHSFFIEIIYNFGFVGFIPLFIIFLSIFILLIKKRKIHKKYRFLLINFIYFSLLINVSSSIVRKPSTWIVYSIIIVALFVKENTFMDNLEKKQFKELS